MHSDDSCVIALLNLLNAKGSFTVDERANTVEIICKDPVDVSKEVKGIVLPESMLRKQEINRFIEKNKIPVKTYEVRMLTSPLRYNEIVFQNALEFV